jgi:sarcosine oxidase subunit alpha
MSKAKRLENAGRLNRAKLITLTFDGMSLQGYEEDSLASVLLANNVGIVGRSFKYHRPRGVFSAGCEEPGAMVHLREGDRHEPNARATQVEAFDGLVSSGQNAFPSVRFDVGAVNQLFSPFFSAGFYYKTFMGWGSGTKFWMMCEHVIRKAAGMGRATTHNDPDSYDKVNAFCDLLIVGSGPAGLSAALAAGRSGLNVLLVEQDIALGGSLLSEPTGTQNDDWLQRTKAELERLSNVRILTRATVFGGYDGNVYGIIERKQDHVKAPNAYQVRQTYWQVRTQKCICATGAIERPLVFANNDRPGVMMAASVRTYLNRYGILAGQDILVSTNNDSAYQTAQELAQAGASVTLLDTRPDPAAELLELVGKEGVQVKAGYGILKALGSRAVKGAQIARIDHDGRVIGKAETMSCDLIAMAGGWVPVIHLWSQRARKPVYNDEKRCFLPDEISVPDMVCTGAMMAEGDLSAVARQSHEATCSLIKAMGKTAKDPDAAPNLIAKAGDDHTRQADQVWAITDQDGETYGKAFIDFQHDVTRADIDLAHREGYVSVEHLKRYTTSGMATDQGKLSNLNALSRMAELREMDIPKVGTTTFRPPYTPIAFGALVGREHGHHFNPTRLTSIDDWHHENGAVMTQAGAWMRPWYYPQGSEDLRSAYIREAAHVREHVGMVDVSTLGKIMVQGPDAAEFLNRIYVNGWKTLKVDRIRYGVMLREDGFMMDDGTTARVGEQDYFMTTTTANAAKVLAFMEHLLQTAWTDLKVHVTSVTDQWGAIAVAGPKSRDLLQSLIKDADLSKEALPNNAIVYGTVNEMPVRVHRMSYSGELAYELYVGAGHAYQVWQALSDAGKGFNLKPYGTESMGALRIEKGHVAGPELDGRTTMKDLALDGFASRKKPFVGSILRQREVLVNPSRPSLVGLEIEGEKGALSGALLFGANKATKGHGEGHVTSTTYSPALGKNIALALLADGPNRMGETVQVVDFVGHSNLKAKVVSPHFFDPEGVRQNA